MRVVHWSVAFVACGVCAAAVLLPVDLRAGETAVAIPATAQAEAKPAALPDTPAEGPAPPADSEGVKPVETVEGAPLAASQSESQLTAAEAGRKALERLGGGRVLDVRPLAEGYRVVIENHGEIRMVTVDSP